MNRSIMIIINWFTRITLIVVSVDSLICPLYNTYNNETRKIQSCQKPFPLCRYMFIRSGFRRCLGIYQLEKNQILIRQLAILDDLDNRYVNQTECILEIDRTGQSLLCRCNADNCTLNWQTETQLSDQLSDPGSYLKLPIIEEKLDNSWFFPLILLGSITLLVIMTIAFLFFVHRCRKPIIKESISPLNAEDWSNNLIISQGKTSIIYQKSAIDKIHAIKLYHSSQSIPLFENESSILGMTEHAAIIKMIGNGWNGPSPYIILEYHPIGSLQAYLQAEKLPWKICYSFLESLLQAVDYLHYEELSTNDYFTLDRVRKPIIVHRDIKSSNVVVRSTPVPSLCLIDFGLAKILPPVLTPMDFVQIGTYRYMAPELLELAISHTNEALCKVDMYSLGLVLWEIVCQCEIYPCSISYQMPYEEYLKSDETNENHIVDILHRVVVNERKRPILHRSSTMISTMDQLFNIIEDCWKHEPEFRISARPALSRLRRLQIKICD